MCECQHSSIRGPDIKRTVVAIGGIPPKGRLKLLGEIGTNKAGLLANKSVALANMALWLGGTSPPDIEISYRMTSW